MFLLYLLLWRYRNLKNSFTRIKQNSDCVKSSVSTKPIVHKFETVRKGTIPVYEYQFLKSATNKFSDSNVLSRGGRGCLYRACLDEMSSLTLKKLDGGGETDIEKQFETEVDWLAKIRHQNIVSLLGFCVYRQTRFVVYEMMQNETLESHLHVLYDIGVVSTKEPFKCVIDQGIILGEVQYTAWKDQEGNFVSADNEEQLNEHQQLSIPEENKSGDHFVLKEDPSIRLIPRTYKMSKSRGNVINPDDVVLEYGADSLRLYEMFMGPFSGVKHLSRGYKKQNGVRMDTYRRWKNILVME